MHPQRALIHNTSQMENEKSAPRVARRFLRSPRLRYAPVSPPSNHRGNPAKNNATRLSGPPGSALRLVSCPTWVARAETLRQSDTFTPCCLFGANEAKILMRNNDGIHLKGEIRHPLSSQIYADVFIFYILTSLDAFKVLAWGFMGLSCAVHSSQCSAVKVKPAQGVSSR